MSLKQTSLEIDRRKAAAAIAAGAATVFSLGACSTTQQGSSTTSAPQVKDGLAPLSRIAFGSCADQNKDQPVWEAVLADRPDLMLFGGDNIYYSPPDWNVTGLRQAYAQWRALPNVAKMLATVPHMETWDDHDFGINDGGVEWANKQAAKEEFLNFYGAPVFDPRRSRPGLYREQVFGPVGKKIQVIMLDARWFRSPLKLTDQRNAPGKERYVPDTDTTKTMLGAAQWQWLEGRLREPAELRLIVSGVQMIAEGHGWESWSNFPHERERLVKLIADTRAEGAILLSGDRHIGAFYRRPAQAGLVGSYPLVEMTSSGLTHAWAQASEAGPNRIGELVTSNHYALIQVDWASHKLSLQFKAINGQLLRELQVDFKELRA